MVKYGGGFAYLNLISCGSHNFMCLPYTPLFRSQLVTFIRQFVGPFPFQNILFRCTSQFRILGFWSTVVQVCLSVINNFFKKCRPVHFDIYTNVQSKRVQKVKIIHGRHFRPIKLFFILNSIQNKNIVKLYKTWIRYFKLG